MPAHAAADTPDLNTFEEAPSQFISTLRDRTEALGRT